MAISFVADSSWDSNVNAASYTITKPSGTASGDLMIAMVAINLYPSGSSVTISVPSGWTKREDIFSYPNCQAAVMTRVAGSSEPGSWNGTLSGSREQRVTVCGTYRGTAAIGVDGQSSIGSATSLTTATINNPAATNWRLVFGAYCSGSASYTIASNEVTNRQIDQATGGSGGAGAVQAGLWDSGGTIGTGNTNRNVTRGAVWESALSYITVLDNTDGTVATGTLSATLPKLTMTAAANLNFSGTMAANLPKPTMTAEGIASPPEGPLDVLVLPVMTAAMFTDASGTLDVMAGPIVTIAVETRAFGIRVVTPEVESRVITPRRGAVD